VSHYFVSLKNTFIDYGADRPMENMNFSPEIRRELKLQLSNLCLLHKLCKKTKFNSNLGKITVIRIKN
jgi:hypothetical protein